VTAPGEAMITCAPGEVPAAVVAAPGAAPSIRPVRQPEQVADSTLLRVVAAPLNPLDLLIASGGFHSARYDRPYVPGSECVGRVLASDRYPAGTLVYAACYASPSAPGALSTRLVVPDDDVLPLPDNVHPVLGAAVGNSGTAAFMPLIEVAGLREGESVLVLGATGAVGQLAVQIARLHGAGRVTAVGRDQAALDRLVPLGADAVVALRPGEEEANLSHRLSAAAGPVDVILDSLYGLPLQAALPGCAPRARIINIGNVAGASAQLPAGLLRGRQLTLSGFAGLHTPLREKRTALNWLWAKLASDELRIDVRTFTLDQLPAAWSMQAGSPHAKCVVLPDSYPPNAPE
jgi:NADPH2:quinone reductase